MKKILLSALVALVAFASCGNKTENCEKKCCLVGKTILPIEILGEKYCPKSTEKAVALVFDSVKITGNFGCNLFFADYKLTDDSLSFTNPGLSMMMCDSASNAVEMALTDVFARVNRYSCCKEEHILSFYQDEELLAKFKVVCPEEGCCGEKSCCKEGEHKCCKEGEHKCCKEGEHKCCKEHAENEK